ncbi:translation initiation factor IF-2, partial [Arthrobacter agilis]
MAKVRVHELAKELGITSKDAVAKLQELGEFVRSASSTIEAPVVKKLRGAFPDAGSTKTAAPSAPSRPAAPAPSGPKPGAAQAAPEAPAPAAPAAPSAPSVPSTPAAPATP